jgi:hypothetical protein
VDDEDYALLMLFKWHAMRYKGNKVYACRTFRDSNGIRKHLFMHQFLLGITDTRIKGDHKDGDGLNNQKYNLRKATYAQNNSNIRRRKDNLSGVHGVRFNQGKWEARIGVAKKNIWLGRFSSIEEAAKARKDAELKYHGEFSAHLSQRL